MNKHEIAWHLQFNLYPPQPLELIPLVVQALRFLNTGDAESEYVHYPDGSFEHASSLIDNLGLWELVTPE